MFMHIIKKVRTCRNYSIISMCLLFLDKKKIRKFILTCYIFYMFNVNNRLAISKLVIQLLKYTITITSSQTVD